MVDEGDLEARYADKRESKISNRRLLHDSLPSLIYHRCLDPFDEV